MNLLYLVQHSFPVLLDDRQLIFLLGYLLLIYRNMKPYGNGSQPERNTWFSTVSAAIFGEIIQNISELYIPLFSDMNILDFYYSAHAKYCLTYTEAFNIGKRWQHRKHYTGLQNEQIIVSFFSQRIFLIIGMESIHRLEKCLVTIGRIYAH